MKIRKEPLQYLESIQHQIYNVTGGVERLIGGVVTTLVVIVSDLVLLLVILVGLMFVDPITSIGTFIVFAGIGFFSVIFDCEHPNIKHLVTIYTIPYGKNN